MSDQHLHHAQADLAPGDEEEGRIGPRLLGYFVGLWACDPADRDVVLCRRHRPRLAAVSIPVAIIVLAIAQMGVHLVFFLHITTGADNTNNVLALAFGLLIVFLVIGGSLWIMANLNHNMMPMDQIMQMQR